MFTQPIEHELKRKLDKNAISQRQQAGLDLDYIEAWYAIDQANRIFGFGNWSRETVHMEKVSETKTRNNKIKVGYIARVRIVVVGQDGGAVVREGTGAGSGIAADPYDAHEGATKEAESDAMKRALMTFGNQFGLALYDKSRANVADYSQINEILENARSNIETLEKATPEIIEKFASTYVGKTKGKIIEENDLDLHKRIMSIIENKGKKDDEPTEQPDGEGEK